MIKKMGVQWHLRLRMAEKGYFQTSDLVPLLAERGVMLSREQVFRLVTQPPQRLSMDTLAALCDILGCGPGDLVEPVTGTAGPGRPPAAPWPAPRPVRARVTGRALA